MRLLMASFAFWLVSAAGNLLAQADESPEDVDISATYSRIVADYQQIEATRNRPARDAAARLVGDAYRLLVDQAAKVTNKSADDLYALGACHEGLGDRDAARQLYAQSLVAAPSAKTHLALVRVYVNDDLAAAEKHFAAAQQVDPQYPGLSQFRLLLANAHLNKQQWSEAASHLSRYLDYVQALADNRPGDQSRQARAATLEQRLRIVRLYADLSRKPAPELDVRHWVQGDVAGLAALKGKVVAIDFCAMWAAPSRARIETMKKLHAKYAAKGLEVVGVTLAYGHGYDAETDTVDRQAGRNPEEELVDLEAFAKQHEVEYRLAMVDKTVTQAYGVTSLPHTVLVDPAGVVHAILPGGGQQADALLEAKIMDLLGLP